MSLKLFSCEAFILTNVPWYLGKDREIVG